MLHPEAVETSILELIQKLQSKKYLHGFYLVGGTALALKMGYRKSVDIDLFSNFNFDSSQMLENIHQDFPFQLYYSDSNTLKGSIDNVKVDILAHRYKYIGEQQIINGIFILSIQDIIAMKLNAISTIGQRSKDFIDIYYLLNEYDIASMLSFYKKKYNQQNDAIVLKSLIYFDDVDLSDWPLLIQNPELKWANVKSRIEKEIIQYAKKT